MSQSVHVEKHFTASDFVRDSVIGMADGLTVPFALAAGLAGAVSTTGIIVTAGIAEIVAGSIAMGLGGFLAAKTDAEHYETERQREEREVREKTDAEVAEIHEILDEYGLSKEEIHPIVEAFRTRPQRWIDFMMRFELGMEKPDPLRARNSALTIGGAYVAGGFIPLLPYMLFSNPTNALLFSVVLTLIALAFFGYTKGRYTGSVPTRSSLQTTLVGGMAAGAAFIIARLVS